MVAHAVLRGTAASLTHTLRLPALRLKRSAIVGFQLGRLLVVFGLILVAAGVLVLIVNRLNLPLGRLPGDITYRGKNTTFYFPVITCLILSALASLVLWLFNRR
jgi:hypothetical protein